MGVWNFGLLKGGLQSVRRCLYHPFCHGFMVSGELLKQPTYREGTLIGLQKSQCFEREKSNAPVCDQSKRLSLDISFQLDDICRVGESGVFDTNHAL